MEAHITNNGFNPLYTKYILHSEVDIPIPDVLPKVVHEDDIVEDEMIDMIYVFIGPSNDLVSNNVDVEDDVPM